MNKEPSEAKRQRIKNIGTGSVGWFLAACQIVLTLLLGLAALIVGVEVISLLFAALQGKPFTLKGNELENLQWGVLVLVVLGPVAYAARSYLYPD